MGVIYGTCGTSWSRWARTGRVSSRRTPVSIGPGLIRGGEGSGIEEQGIVLSLCQRIRKATAFNKGGSGTTATDHQPQLKRKSSGQTHLNQILTSYMKRRRTQ